MTFSSMSLPILTVNGYLWDTMKNIEPSFETKYGLDIPFFPISDAASGSNSWENKAYIVYDRMLRTRRSPFPYIKNEHIMYYVKGKEIQTLEWGMAIQTILDRMDDAAQDINDWNRSQAEPSGVYFHHLRVHQTGSGDMGSASTTRDFSVRPYYITKFIIEAEYHFTEPLEFFLS